MEDHYNFSEEVPNIIRDPRTLTRYNRGEFLGNGSFGKCYLFSELGNGKEYAGKVIMKSILKGNLSMVYNETNIQMNLRHQNILRMLRYFYCTTYVCMILELCSDTLGDILKRLKVLDEPSCRFVLREVACGISYLHQKRVIHRDIKPDNIFLTKDMDIKIGDFGNAVKDVDSADKFTKASGTPSYLSPESLDDTGYSFGNDVWALGTTLYEMIVGHVPFEYKTEQELHEKIKICGYSIPWIVPVYTADMVRIIFTRDPSSRPTIEDVLKSDYLSSKNISKDNLRGYMSRKPLAKTINKEDPHECNAMLPSKNETVLNKDCRLDESRRTGNIILKKFKCDITNIGNPNVLGFCFDDPFENENVSQIELKLDIEKKSIFVSKGIRIFINILFENKSKMISSSEMDRNALSCSSRPKHYITRWIDFNEKYGLGYQLSDFSVGVLFKDKSHLLVDGTMKNFQYMDKYGARKFFEYNKCPAEL